MLAEAMAYAVDDGKRLRPRLVFATMQALDEAPSKAIDVALAIELVHAYSLVHDDLPAMDNDDFRRGKPSLHKQFDEGIAILVGDVLQAEAFRLLAQQGNVEHKIPALVARVAEDTPQATPPSKSGGIGLKRLAQRFQEDKALLRVAPSEIVEELCETISSLLTSQLLVSTMAKAAGVGGMVSGQYRDIQSENSIAMRRQKTGMLMGFSCAAASIVADPLASERHDQLFELGTLLGTAYQHHDDRQDGDAFLASDATAVSQEALTMLNVLCHALPGNVVEFRTLAKSMIGEYADYSESPTHQEQPSMPPRMSAQSAQQEPAHQAAAAAASPSLHQHAM